MADKKRTLQVLLNWIQGSVFCCLWYCSICSGFLFLYCPLLPLLLFNQKLYRRTTDAIFAAWEMYPVAMLECLMGTRVVVTGDKILPQDRAILVMNHRTRLDWNFLWAAMFHACQPLAHRLKFVLKSPIRHVPGPGWVMQMNCFMYIHRRWERDKQLLARALDYLADIDYTYQVLLFPEGTDLTAKSRERSHQFAATHGLEQYQQVLHPKTTGFVFLAQRMRQNNSLDAVYDLSIGYPCNLPQSELELVRGNFPKEVHFHITRYPSSCLPYDDAALRDWLSSLWRRKESALSDFYSRGSFLLPPPSSPGTSPHHNLNLNHLPSSNYNSCNSFLADHPPSPSPTLSRHSPNPHHNHNHLPSPDYSDLLTPTTPGRGGSNHFNHVADRASHRNHGDANRLRDMDSTSPRYHSSALHLALMFWTSLCAISTYLVLTSCLVRYYAACHIALFVLLSFVSEGINHVEISLHAAKRRWARHRDASE